MSCSASSLNIEETNIKEQKCISPQGRSMYRWPRLIRFENDKVSLSWYHRPQPELSYHSILLLSRRTRLHINGRGWSWWVLLGRILCLWLVKSLLSTLSTLVGRITYYLMVTLEKSPRFMGNEQRPCIHNLVSDPLFSGSNYRGAACVSGWAGHWYQSSCDWNSFQSVHNCWRIMIIIMYRSCLS